MYERCYFGISRKSNVYDVNIRTFWIFHWISLIFISIYTIHIKHISPIDSSYSIAVYPAIENAMQNRNTKFYSLAFASFVIILKITIIDYAPIAGGGGDRGNFIE